MTDHRILLIENPASITIDHSRLKISRDESDDSFILPSDIAVLCLHHHTVMISNNALMLLADAGASVLITDKYHHPSALLLPIAANQSLAQRLRQQISILGSDTEKIAWMQLVHSKITTQANNLRLFSLNGALRLERLTQTLTINNTINHEAQAARHYWNHLFGSKFKRNKKGARDNLNTHMNYAYAVLRAMIARQLVINGLTPALGLGHNNQQNPFNLADDFIEPYRFLVERHIYYSGFEHTEICSQSKAHVMKFIEQEVEIEENSYRLASGIAESVASYCRLLENGKGKLALPTNASSRHNHGY